MPETVELSLIKPLQTSKLKLCRLKNIYVHFLPVFPYIRKILDFRKNKILVNVHYTVYNIEVVRHRRYIVLQWDDTQGNDV